MASSTASVIFLTLFILQLACACMNLPSSHYIGQRAYFLRQGMECRGGKVYEINNVRDIGQCEEACKQFDCAAVNLYQLGEFQFMCEILSYYNTLIPAQGAACYVGA